MKIPRTERRRNDDPENISMFQLDAGGSSGRTAQIVVDQLDSFDEDIGPSKFEIINLKNGGFISLSRIKAVEDMTISADPLHDQMRVISMMAFSGRTLLSFPTTDHYEINTTQGINFRYLDSPGTFHIKSGQMVDTFGLTLTPETFSRYLDNDIPDALRSIVEPREAGHMMTPFPISAQMHKAIASSIRPNLTGTFRELQMEGTALLYISLMAAAVISDFETPAPAIAEKERRAVRDAYELLSANVRETMALSELSDAVGMSERRLNSAFREIFGATAFEIAREQRLSLARELLEQGELAIKEVAWEVGYAHVSNFSAAFAAKFGITPAACARQQPIEEDNTI